MDGISGDAPGTVLRLDHESRRAGRLDADHVLNSSVIALPSALRPVLLSRITSSRAFEEWFRSRAESGTPMFLEVAAELADFPGLQKLAILADGSPFLWKCTFSQFARWQLVRRRTCAVVRRTGKVTKCSFRGTWRLVRSRLVDSRRSCGAAGMSRGCRC